MQTDGTEEMLAHRRAVTVAAAGCGKTELLARIVASERSGRQLILTHTHAGVAAIKRRLVRWRVPSSKYNVATVDGWCLRYARAFPSISLVHLDGDMPDWGLAHDGMVRVARSTVGKRVLSSSYDGVLVDEYQDCSDTQHGVVTALAESLPCRAVGDSLQSIFNFKDNRSVSWDRVLEFFTELPALVHPWRWARVGDNATLGEWLTMIRPSLMRGESVVVEESGPARWVAHSEGLDVAGVCWKAAKRGGSVVAILNRPEQCIALSKRLGGKWPVVERFDSQELFACARDLGGGGAACVLALATFMAARMTGMGTELRSAVNAISEGRSTARLTKHPAHVERLRRLATAPSPDAALAFVQGALSEPGWTLYRPECVSQLVSALKECRALSDLPAAAKAARERARHRGRRIGLRSIGTPLLVKGLEFDHAVVFWEPEHMTPQCLYVALTRASRSLTIVSATRTLLPTASELGRRSG